MLWSYLANSILIHVLFISSFFAEANKLISKCQIFASLSRGPLISYLLTTMIDFVSTLFPKQTVVQFFLSFCRCEISCSEALLDDVGSFCRMDKHLLHLSVKRSNDPIRLVKAFNINCWQHLDQSMSDVWIILLWLMVTKFFSNTNF